MAAGGCGLPAPWRAASPHASVGLGLLGPEGKPVQGRSLRSRTARPRSACRPALAAAPDPGALPGAGRAGSSLGAAGGEATGGHEEGLAVDVLSCQTRAVGGGVNCPRCWPWALTVAPEGLEAAHGHMLGTCGRWGRWGSRGRSAAGPLARPPDPPGGRHQPAMACVGSVLGLPGGPGGHARGSSRMAAEGLRTVGASPVQRAHGASEGGACPCGRTCSREHRAWGSSSLPWGAGAVRSPMATEEVPLCQRQHLWQLRAEQEAGCLGVAGGRSGSDRPLRVWSYVMWPDRVSSSGRLTSGQRC